MKRRISAVTLVFLIIFSTGYPVYSAENEGYGEDQTSLGQFVDSFKTPNNVSVAVNVIRNATLEVMELNFTSGSLDYLNLSTFTEVDPGADMTVTDDRNTWSQMPRNINNYLYYDFGINQITDWYYEATINMSDVEAGDGSNAGAVGFLSVSNVLGNVITLRGNDVIMVYAIQNGANDDKFHFTNIEYSGGAFKGGVTGAIRDIGVYYVIWNRTGNDVFFGSYSDAAHTVLLDDLSFVATGNDDYRYVEVGFSFGGASDPNDHTSGYIEEVWNGSVSSGYLPSGYFTTTDYLSDPFASGSALVALFNTTIPANTQILIEFSEDNSSWVFNDWQPLFGGFEAVDLRNLNYSAGYYVRGNLSTTNSAVTPRMYQSRLITTEGEVGPEIPGLNVSGIWIEYQATSIANLTGIHTEGDLNSTFFIDGDTWNHTEVAGPPGHLISINFTGVDPDAECLWVTIWYSYTGNVQHDFDIEMWNFTGSSWVDDGHLVDSVGFQWANSTIYAMRIPLDFLSDGEVRVQLNHEPPGNVNHELFIDYVRLIAKIPSDVEAEVFQFFWIVIGIALMIIGIVLARMWPDERDP